MKTAISLPDDLFREIDERARQLKLTRSRLIANATREYLSRRPVTADTTAAWNRALAKAGYPAEEAAAAAFRRRSKTVIRRTGAGRRPPW